MEQRNPKFRLRLNLFDTIVIVVALAAAAFLLWNRLKPSGSSIGSTPAAVPIQYTIRLQQVQAGLGERVHPGDKLEDTVKNYELGQVVSHTVRPATQNVLDQNAKTFVLAEVPGYYDVEIVVESTATSEEDKILVGSGYELRVGERIYVRGPGYMGSGDVYAIERVF